MRRLVPAALAAAAILAVPALASSATKTYYPGCDGSGFTVKPKSETIACGDGSFLITHMKWSSWGTKSAAGSGKASINGCEPNCAEGKFKNYAATVKLSKPKSCDGLRAFSKIEIDFKGTPPAGLKKKYTQRLDCPALDQQG